MCTICKAGTVSNPDPEFARCINSALSNTCSFGSRCSSVAAFGADASQSALPTVYTRKPHILIKQGLIGSSYVLGFYGRYIHGVLLPELSRDFWGVILQGKTPMQLPQLAFGYVLKNLAQLERTFGKWPTYLLAWGALLSAPVCLFLLSRLLH